MPIVFRVSDPGTLTRGLVLAVLVYLALAFTKPAGFTAVTVLLVALALVILLILVALAVHGIRGLRSR